MKKRVLTKWLKALRSGKYKQGRGTLCQTDKNGNESFCCLGVLCDLYQKEQKRNKKRGLHVETISDESSTFGILVPKPASIYSYDDCDGTLPNKVIKWAGLREYNSDGEFLYDGEGKTPVELINLNDGNSDLKVKRHSFAKIADIIEKHHTKL